MMKKFFILLIGFSILTSCKKDTKSVVGIDGPEKTAKQSDGLTLMSGEFIYYADAAVLQIGNNVYGVVINDKMKELHNMGKPYRTESTDGILVQIRGEIIPKPKDIEGWPYNIDIKEIINVKKLNPKQNEVVKIGK